MPDVQLQINGSRYGGWQSIRIRRSLEQVAGTFALTVSERWAEQATPRPIHPGDACQVLVDGEPVITGFVDGAALDYDDQSHRVSLTGRDATGDLVDCSAPPTQWQGRTLPQVAAELCRPFGIDVRAQTDAGGPFRTLASQPGDTVFEALEAASRIRGVLLVSDGRGALVITRAGAARAPTALALGENLLSAALGRSHRDRYSRYTVLGQRAGTDTDYGESVAQPVGQAVDARITRHRPLTVLAEEPIDTAAATARADWERNVRAGRGQRLSATVHGWRHSAGLWAPNQRVPVRDKLLGIDADWLLVDVTYRLDAGGQLADLTLMPPEAFDRQPLLEADAV